MHQLVLRKCLTLELPHVEKIHFLIRRVAARLGYVFFIRGAARTGGAGGAIAPPIFASLV